MKKLVERYSMGRVSRCNKPYPFEFGPENIKDNRVEWQDGNAETDIDNTGLMKCYKSMRFEKLGNSDFMVLDLS